MHRVGLLLLSGCIASSPLSLPDEASTSQSALLALETEEGAEVFAIDLANGVFVPITTPETPLYLFLYDSTLSTLGIAPGKLERPGEMIDSRTLPIGAIYVARLPETEWAVTDREALPDSIESFRLPDLPLGACELGGGCFRIVAGEEFCQQPCVEPSDADPAPPTMASPPQPPELGPSPGGECPPGLYRESLPDGPKRFVDPAGDIQAAIDAAASGDIIVVAKGTYSTPLIVDRSVEIVGACAETIVAAAIDVTGEARIASLSVRGSVAVVGSLELEDVAIEGSRSRGLSVGAGATLTALRIRLSDNAENLRVEGGTAVLEDALLESPSVESNVSVVGPAALTLRRAILSGSRRFGLYATAGTVTLEDVVVRDNLTAQNQGEGIVIDGPVVLEARRLAIERVDRYGIRVLSRDETAELVLDDLTIREVTGYGIEMGTVFSPAASSSFTIHRMFAEQIDELAISSVSGEANELTDAVLRDLPSGGISTIGGVLDLTRAELARIGGASLAVTSGEMSLNDLRIIDPENGLVTEGWVPTDVSAIDSAMTANRFSISGATGAGILIRQFSRMRLIAGRIFDNDVGVEVRADGFVFSNLEGDVIYRDNLRHNLLNVGQMPE